MVNKDGFVLLSTNPTNIGKISSISYYNKNFDKTNTKGNLPTYITNIKSFSPDYTKDQLIKFISYPISNALQNSSTYSLYKDKENQNENNKSFFISISAHTDSINNITLDRKGLGKTGEVYLVNKDRTMISPSRFVDNEYPILVNTLPVKQCFNNGSSNDTDDIYNDYRNIPIVGYSYCAKDLGFVLIAEIDKSEVLHPIIELRNTMIMTSTTGSMIIVLISIFIIVLIMSWNKNLKKAVAKSTSDLRKTLESLTIVNEQLKTNDKIKEEFINIAAHELRTPAQVISGYCDMIRYSPDKTCDYIKIIERNAQRLHNLVNNILDITKIEGNNLHLNKVIFDFKKIILQVFEDIYDQYNNKEHFDNDKIGKNYETFKKGNNNANDIIYDNVFNVNTHLSNKQIKIQLITIGFSSKYEPILINADKARINQVITNLLSNAIKFAKENHAKITMIIEKEIKSDLKSRGKGYKHTDDKSSNSNTLIFKIIDNGKGIDKDILPRLFDKFVTNSEKGTGLGLYISKKIIEAHGGQMWAYSNMTDSGATFGFSLPLKN